MTVTEADFAAKEMHARNTQEGQFSTIISVKGGSNRIRARLSAIRFWPRIRVGTVSRIKKLKNAVSILVPVTIFAQLALRNESGRRRFCAGLIETKLCWQNLTWSC
jgi:hypothetical protein